MGRALRRRTAELTLGAMLVGFLVLPGRAKSCVPKQLEPYSAVFRAAAELYALPVELLWAVVWTESHGKRDARSSAGAVGLGQLMPRTARSQGVWDRTNPFQAVLGAARYLRLQINRFDGDLVLALAAYNAGPGAVRKYGGVPPFRETRRYVPRVLRRYQALARCSRAEFVANSIGNRVSD